MKMGQQNARCECGQVDYGVQAQPLIRAICHCTICQAFNQAPYADICIYKARDVEMPDESLVRYKSWQSPKVVHRGVCVACEKPIVEKLTMPLLPNYVMVPTRTLQNSSLVPDAEMHVFYHSRLADIDDELPKYNGYLRSQTAFLRKLWF